jgi:Vacuolar protein sorting-associated protein 62
VSTTQKPAAPEEAPEVTPEEALEAVQLQVQFGDLVLRFTSSFEFRYNDRGSGANLDGSFWHPKPPTGFHALGSIGMSSYNDPNGKVAALCVKASEPLMPGLQKPALKPPTDYEFIWNDKGSGATHDGSCWRPLAPEGYVALGDVFAQGYNKPPLNDVMCVARELAFDGEVGVLIWNDKGSGANRDLSTYQINPSRAYRESSEGLFAVNSFVGVQNYSKPPTSPVANTLRLPVPVVESGEAPLPQLTSKTKPPAHTLPVVDRVVTVPFTAVIDGDKTIEWILQNSPFYTVQRSVYYDLLIFDDNARLPRKRKADRYKPALPKRKPRHSLSTLA